MSKIPNLLSDLLQIIGISLFGVFFAVAEKIWSYFEFEKPFKSCKPDKSVEHKVKVSRVVEQILEWNMKHKKKGVKMCTARANWKSVSPSKINKNGYYQIDLGSLNDIVHIDYENELITIEPGMSMGRLTSVLKNSGYTLPIVPELDTLTVGGIIAGAGLETSSHIHGMFSNIVKSYEIVLHDAQVLKCSKEENSDLFHAVSGSYATLGFLTAVTFHLIKATSHVRLSYTTCPSIPSALSLIKEQCPSHDFVEGLAFADDKVAVVFGDMVEKAEGGKANPINRFYKPFYYKHVENIIGKHSSYVETVPLKDYYHRHTRSIFWMTPRLIPALRFELVHRMLGWVLPRDVNFVTMITPRFIAKQIAAKSFVQDYILKISEVPGFMEKASRMLKIYPIWLCPTKIESRQGMFPTGDELFIDVGYYGVPKGGMDIPAVTHELELLCIKAKGVIGLYADCYLSRKEFRQMFDTRFYDKVRKDRGAFEAFPDIYDKISPVARGLIVENK